MGGGAGGTYVGGTGKLVDASIPPFRAPEWASLDAEDIQERRREYSLEIFKVLLANGHSGDLAALAVEYADQLIQAQEDPVAEEKNK